ncbi:hypothetical protein [Flagellimonas meishanensis]|uniref:hypothetical protein n=1 Tax=Flagellimonas meishanensis TaxID=2873264 RepID=UPI00223C479B|nr:hypothetical protein [[Muricauda] meishanensis]
MKNSCYALLFCFSVLSFSQEVSQPEAAIPGLTQFDKIRDFTLDNTGAEAYFTIQSQTEEISVIVTAKKELETWSPPELVRFSGRYRDMEPFLSPDGLRLYFVSNRPLHDSINKPKDFDIWFVERSDVQKEWSAPINLGGPVNTEHNEFYPSLAENGNLYFTSDSPESIGKDDIFFSARTKDGYSKPVSLSASINSEGFEYNAYISRDESYLIFGGYNREDGLGSGDLYISFKRDGEWTQAKPLPMPINSSYMDYCPFMDESNGVLYLTSRRTKNPTEGLEDMDTLSSFLNSYENGNSRLYQVKFNPNGLERQGGQQ